MFGGLLWLGQSACGGVVQTGDAGGNGGAGAGANQTYACSICANAKLSCVVSGNMDTLTRAATSSTGCAFDFGDNQFSVDCDSQTFCIEGFGCSTYAASGSGFSVKTSLGGVQCSPAK